MSQGVTVVTIVLRNGRVEYVGGVRQDETEFFHNGLALVTDEALIDITYPPRVTGPDRLDVLVRNPQLYGDRS